MLIRYILSPYDRRLLPLMASVMLVNVLAALDQTALANMLPDIRRDFGGDRGMTWVISGYLMALTVGAPVFGKLGDIGGRRRYLVMSIVIFVLASVACALAPTLPHLVLSRIAQGIGAAGIFAIPNAILADEVPGRERGKYQIFISAVWLVAALCGPAFGGMLQSLASWRALFWINLPLGLIAVLLILRSVPSRPPTGTGRVDGPGAVFLAVTILGWMLFVVQLGHQPFTLQAALIGLCAVLATFALALIETKVSDPMLPPRLVRNREFVIGIMVALASSATQLGLLAYLPAYLQSRFSLSAVEAGLAMAPVLVMSPLAVIFSTRRLARTGRYRPLALLGSIVLVAATLLLALLSPVVGLTGVITLASGISLGSSLIGPTLMIGLQNQVDRRDVGLATSMFVVFRNFGGTIGTTFVGVMVLGSGNPALWTSGSMTQGFVLASAGSAVASVAALAGAAMLKDMVLATQDQTSSGRRSA